MANRVATLRGDVNANDAISRNQSAPLLSELTSLDSRVKSDADGLKPREIPSITFDAVDIDAIEERKGGGELAVQVRSFV